MQRRRYRGGAGRDQLRDARRRRLARLHRVDEIHANGRARAGRHRLGKNPFDLLGGTQLGRQCADSLTPCKARWRCCSPPAWPGCGTAMPRSSSRPPRSPPAACWPRRMCSTTTSSCWRSRSHFSRDMDCNQAFADFEISVLAAAWIVPLLARGVAGATGVPLGLIVLLIAVWIHAAPRRARPCGCK